MKHKPANTAYRQGLHRWEPWQVISVAFAAGAAFMGAVLLLLAGL